MILTPEHQRVDVTDLTTGKPVEAEILTEAEAREVRRRQRRKQRTQQEQGLRILNTALRQVGRGRVDQAGATVMAGFGKLILNAALGRLKHGD